MSQLQTRFCPRCRLALTSQELVCPRDGEDGIEFDPVALPKEVIERFDIVDAYARGDSGALFLADEKATQRRGILKLIWPEITFRISDRARLRRELLRLSSLQHASIITPYLIGEAQNQIWLFRPWVEGVSLEVKLSRTPDLPTAEAIHIATQVTECLEVLHQAGIIHRNIKAGHIILTPQASGYPKVSLIDACVFLEPYFLPSPKKLSSPPSTSDPHQPILTTHPAMVTKLRTTPETGAWRQSRTLAPEQIDGRLTTFRSDLYALGALMYELFEQRPMFAHADIAAWLKAHLHEKPAEMAANINPELKKTILALVSKESSERPFAAQHVRSVLSPFVADATNPNREITHEFLTPAAGISRCNLPVANSVPGEAPVVPPGTLRPHEPFNTSQSKPSGPPPIPRSADSTRDNTMEISGLFELREESKDVQDAQSHPLKSSYSASLPMLKFAQSVVPAWVYGAATGALLVAGVLCQKTPAPKKQPHQALTVPAPQAKLRLAVTPQPILTVQKIASPPVAVEKSDAPIEGKQPKSLGGTTPIIPEQRDAGMFEKIRNQARAHFQAKQYRQAASAYLKATQIKPRNSGVWAGLGASYYALSDFKQAVRAYQKASKLAPKTAGFWLALGQSYAALGQKTKAAHAYKTALKFDPSNVQGKSALAKLQ